MKFTKRLRKGLETIFESIFSQSQAVLPDDNRHPNVESFIICAGIIMAAPSEPWRDKYQQDKDRYPANKDRDDRYNGKRKEE